MPQDNFRIVYMGTPDFAVYPLKELCEKGYHVVGVVTNPDKPAGRGQKLNESAVKKYAVSQGLPLLQPEKFRDPLFLEELKSWKADLNIVVAFKMLPEVVWNMPRLGTINLHASLLPDYRGAAPINRVIMNGEKKTGITTFLLNEGMDTGRLLFREEVVIGEDMTAGELHDILMVEGAGLLLKTVDALIREDYPQTDQNDLLQGREPKHAPKIFKEDMRIDWTAGTEKIYNHIRGLSPYPAAWTELKAPSGEIYTLKIFDALKEISSSDESPGKILSDNKSFFKIKTGDGWIHVKDLQLSGKKRMKVEDFLRGFSVLDFEKTKN